MTLGHFARLALSAGLVLSAGAAAAASCPPGYSPFNNLCTARPICPSGYYYPNSGSVCKSTSPSNHRSYTPSCPSPSMTLRGNSCYSRSTPGGAYPARCNQGGFLQSGRCVVVFPMTVNASCPPGGSMAGYSTCVARKR